jgi:tetraacyldisaccharide 4'-kinase
MREPPFWWQPQSRAAALLSPLAHIYGAVAAARLVRAGESAGIKVVCVGNPTLGGAGKTPMALAIAAWLKGAGEAPFFLTRGYGGRLAGPIEVDPRRHNAADVGDEPLLLARVAPTIVARDRRAGARAARAGGASVVVMDDGFQNPSLHKDFSVLMVDARRGLGNGRVFPAGPLRAPLAPQLDRAGALVVIGTEGAAASFVQGAGRRDLPLFSGRLDPDAERLAALREKKILAFAGIGDPGKFFATLSGAGLDVRLSRTFPDHYRYDAAAARALLAQADEQGLTLVTTEKDMARIAGERALAALAARAQALPVRLVLADADGFRLLLFARLGVTNRVPRDNRASG